MANDKTQTATSKTQTAPGGELQLIKKDIVDVVSGKIAEYVERGALQLPANYSPENAMKAAWLALQSITDKNNRPALLSCTRDSVANALLDMVVQGLNPVKEQCYFIVHGNKLTLRRSYFGTAMVAKHALKLRNIFAAVVYDGDVFEYEIRPDRMAVIQHEQQLENISPDKIIAAYCLLQHRDDRPDYTEIMTIEQIKKSWGKAAANISAATSPHKEFPDQMAKRTVIQRACKLAINTTTDSDVLVGSFNRASYAGGDPVEEAELLQAEADEMANAQLIDFPEEPAAGAGNAGGQQKQISNADAPPEEEPPF